MEYWGAVDGSAVSSGVRVHVLRCAFDSTTHNNYWARYPCALHEPDVLVGDHVGVVSVFPEVY